MHSLQNKAATELDPRNRTDHRIARPLFRTHPLREVIRFYSVKNRCVLWLESFTEVTSCLIREFDPSVKAYTTQPKRIRYRVGDKHYLYTPDAAVLFCDNSRQFEEVKLWKSFKSQSVRQGFEHMQKIFEHVIGIPLVHNPALDGSNCNTALNLEFLYRYLGLPRNTDDISKVLAVAKNDTSVNELIETCCTQHLPSYLAYQILALGYYEWSPRDSLLDLRTQLQRVGV